MNESSEIDLNKAEKSDKPEYTPMQMYRMAAVYDYLAKLLPTEGRDYSVNFVFSEGDNFSLSLIPHTTFGKAWCDYCMEAIRKAKPK